MSSKKTDLFPIPFCLFIGPQRSGTSWLYRYLAHRHDVCLPLEVKEIFFFDRYFKKGVDFYRSHFKIKPEHRMAIEITTTSFAEPEAPQRVYDTFGSDVRLVCPLRHPIIRSYSLYKHFQRYGMVKGDLKTASKQMPEIIETSYYAKYINRWIELFGKESIHFTFQEHLSEDPSGYIKHVCDSIGIQYVAVKDEFSGKYNATAKPPSYMVARLFQKLANLLRGLGLYSVINFAKALGIKKYIFGNANPDADPNPDVMPEKDREFLESHLGKEIKKLEEILGYEITYWK